MRSSINEGWIVEYCAESSQLVARVINDSVSLVITELWDITGIATSGAVAQIRQRFPSLSVVAYCVLRPETSGELLSMARAGVNGFILRGVDDLGGKLRAALAAAEEDSLELVLSRELGALSSADLRSIVGVSLSQARCDRSVGAVAKTLGVSRRTLANRVAQAGWPPPRAIIGWCRLLLAARMLEDPKRSVESVGLSLQFGSGAALANMLRRYTGLPPRELRKHGAVSALLAALRSNKSRAPQEGLAHR